MDGPVVAHDPDDWRRLLERGRWNVVAYEPCTPAAISDAEAALGITLPPELVSLLRFSNGLFDGGGQWHFIWPLDRLVTDNQASLVREMEFPEWLVGFGDDGAGDWFCMPRDIADPAVWHWAWIGSEADRIADDLMSFLTGWMDGVIEV